MKNNNRWKNAGMWISLAGLVWLFLQAVGIDVSPTNQEAINKLVDALIGVLVVMGVLNDPTTKTSGFNDDKEDL